jgi:MFS family permease
MGANAISQIGEGVSAVAIPWFVLETTGSITQTGVVAATTAAARVAGAVLGGPVVDRYGFRPAAIGADVVSGSAVAAIPLLYVTIGLDFRLLLLFVALGAFFDGPGATARDSMVPNLTTMAGMAPERVNSIYQLVPRLAIFIGPAIAGVLVTLIGAGQVLWVNGGTFIVSALIVATQIPRITRSVPTPDPGGQAVRTRPWSGLVEGFRFIASNPLARVIVTMVMALNLLDAPLGSVLLPALVRERYGDATALGLMLSLLGGGAVLSSLVFAVIGPRLPRRNTFLLAYSLVGFPYLVLSLGPPLPVVLLAMFLMGCAVGPINPILMTIRQEVVPEHLRGRVFGAMVAASWAAIPLGQLLGGVLTESFGPRPLAGGIGVCYLAITLSMWLNPAIRDMDLSRSGRSATAAPTP